MNAALQRRNWPWAAADPPDMSRRDAHTRRHIRTSHDARHARTDDGYPRAGIRWEQRTSSAHHPRLEGSGAFRSTNLRGAETCRGSASGALRREPHLSCPHTGFDLPERRMISAVPQPPAVASIISARRTCFCGALRSETIASSRRRPSRVTITTIPAQMTSA